MKWPDMTFWDDANWAQPFLAQGLDPYLLWGAATRWSSFGAQFGPYAQDGRYGIIIELRNATPRKLVEAIGRTSPVLFIPSAYTRPTDPLNDRISYCTGYATTTFFHLVATDPVVRQL